MQYIAVRASIAAASPDKACKQPARRLVRQRRIYRVPQHAVREPVDSAFDRFDHAVRRPGDGAKARRDRFDRLMMIAVDAKRSAAGGMDKP